MASEELRGHLQARLEGSLRLMLIDIGHLPEETLLASSGGKTRSAADIIDECAWLNRRLSMHLRDEEVPHRSDQERQEQVAKLDTCERAVDHLKAATEALVEAWVALEDLEKPIPAFGGTMPAADMISLAASHLMYHDGQLAFIQRLHGDQTNHWLEV